MDVNLVRDKGTGKSKGFAFIAYEDQRSTILAVGLYDFMFIKSAADQNKIELMVLFSCRRLPLHGLVLVMPIPCPFDV